jgi:hypothetical protein
VYSHGWDLLETYVDRALKYSKARGINTFELHDFNIGHRGLVEAAVQYREFPKLARREVLTYRGERCSRAQKETDYQRLRALAKKIKVNGLKLNFWYHTFRDAPEELAVEYPEVKDLNTGFYFAYLDGLLKEFFERVPEVDRLTLKR